jgi:hypothetical protein
VLGVSVRGGNIDSKVLLSFLCGLLGPHAADDVVGLWGRAFRGQAEEVQGDSGKLSSSSTLHEENGVVIGNVKDALEVIDGILVHSHEGLGTMAHLDDRHARTIIVDSFLLNSLNYMKG